MPGPDIIVIGASAGGIEALQTIVSGFPPDLPASIFVVVHTSPEDGHLAEVLSRNGNMSAELARHRMRIDSKCIYVAPPNHHLTVEDRRILLSTGPKINRTRPAIDPLFESAARAYGSRVVGVVLSGYLDDGTAGLAAIKRHGGVAVVQDPKTAVAPDMPTSALRHVKVDYCLPVKDIAPLLVQIVAGTNLKHKSRE